MNIAAVLSLDDVELRVPGHFIRLPDGSYAEDLQALASGLTGKFVEAIVAYLLFRSEPLGRRLTIHDSIERRKGELGRVWAIETQIRVEESEDHEKAFDSALSPEERWRREHERDDRRRAEAERRRRRERWANGEVPDQLLHQVPFVHAEAFIHAADMIGKLLYAIEKDPQLDANSRAAIAGAKAVFDQTFPTLKDTRDSVQHYEERVQGKAKPWGEKKSKPIPMQPLSGDQIFPAGATPLIIGNLRGNFYQTTLGNGQLGSIEVSAGTLRLLRDIVQSVLDALPFEQGIEHVIPGFG